MKNPGAGKLDQRISIKQALNSADGIGGVAESWSELDEVWANVRPISGREEDRQGAVRENRMYMVTIRNRSDILNDMVIDWNGDRYNIRNIKQPTGRKLYLEIVIEYGVAID